MTTFQINKRVIGNDEPCYFIAEMSANHHHDLSLAKEIVHAMKESGADAVKLQTYTADTMTIACDRNEFKVGAGTIWEGRNLHELYREACTPWEWQPELKALAESLGMDCFSTPFDRSAVEFLEQMDVPAHKVASFELVDLPLLRIIARTGKPIIMSTGMGSREEIDDAVRAIDGEGNQQIILLKCTSAYPADPKDMNLATLPDLHKRFKCPVGLSDHTLDLFVPVIARALGACVIEKHFTLDRNAPGPDSAFSLEPEEFREMVQTVRKSEEAMGSVSYSLSEKERASQVFRRSLFVVKDVQKGEAFTSDNVRCIRPGYGLPPKYIDTVLHSKAAEDISRGTPLHFSLLVD